jgi:hypothetical protein
MRLPAMLATPFGAGGRARRHAVCAASSCILPLLVHGMANYDFVLAGRWTALTDAGSGRSRIWLEEATPRGPAQPRACVVWASKWRAARATRWSVARGHLDAAGT